MRGELESYGEDLGEKHEIIALNKCDAVDAELIENTCRALESESGRKVLAISAASKLNVDEALRALLKVSDDKKSSERGDDEKVAWHP